MNAFSALGPRMFETKKSARARELRRKHPIRGYFGLNGSGKSWAMVHDVIPDLEAGRPCLSTVRLLDYKNPRLCELTEETCDDWETHNSTDMDGNHKGHAHPHPLYVPLTEWAQVLDWGGGPVLFDEITGIADSQNTELPPAIGDLFMQLRRENISLSYTSLSYIRANKRIREATRLVSMCESWFPTDAYGPDGEPLMWKQRQVSKIRSYDAKNLTGDIGDKFEEKLKQSRLITGFHWIPGSPASNGYDTLAPVLRIGTVDQYGACARCGGTRRRPACSCPGVHSSKAGGASGRTARRASAEDRTGVPPIEAVSPALQLVPAGHAEHSSGCSC